MVKEERKSLEKNKNKTKLLRESARVSGVERRGKREREREREREIERERESTEKKRHRKSMSVEGK